MTDVRVSSGNATLGPSGWEISAPGTESNSAGTEPTVIDGKQSVAIISADDVDPDRGVNYAEIGKGGYREVAANQTDSALGTGAVGDRIHRLVIVGAGNVSIKDNTTAITEVFAAGNHELNIASKFGGWKVTTPVGATCLVIGDFTA